MSDTSNVILETDGLTKHFGGVTAVSGVNLQIEKGELRCLIGPNGAGKSTYFKLLTGFISPSSGKIFYKGQEITGLHPYQRLRKGIGLKFQTPRIYRSLSVKQNLDIPWTRAGGDESVFDTIMQMSGLRDRLDYRVEELPHGQLQWLEVCMILKTAPAVLLLDEPTAGMTPEETFQTSDIIREINKYGITVIVVEHDMEFIKSIARTVTVLHQGEVFTQGSMDEVASDPRVKKIYLGE